MGGDLKYICFSFGASSILACLWLRKRRLPPGRGIAWAGQSLFGHRGCRLGSVAGQGPPPENSLGAFELAVAEGAQGFELDTRLTRDGVAVVFHDALIGRCLEPLGWGNAQVSDLSVDELQRHTFRNAPGCGVPTLDAAITLAKAMGSKILIETKDIHSPAKLADEVVALIRKHDVIEDVIVISFDPRSLYCIRLRDPEIRTCLLWLPGIVCYWHWTRTEILPWAGVLFAPLLDLILGLCFHPAVFPSFLGCSAIGTQVQYKRLYLKAARRHGMGKYVWTVNDPRSHSEIKACSDDGIFAYATDSCWPRDSS